MNEALLRRTRRSSYRIIKVTDDFVWLEDLKQGLSVTNDAEGVAADIHNHFPDRRIFYKDTEDNWDEIVHKHGEYAGIVPGPYGRQFPPEAAQ